MKYNCNVIRDLIPLLVDGVLSDDSRQVIREHLKECPECRGYYKTCARNISLEENTALDPGEIKDKEYLLSYKKKFRSFAVRLVLASLGIFLICLVLFLGVIAKLTVLADSYKTTDLAEYRNFTGHIEGEAQELFNSRSRLLIFPQEIPASAAVNQFYYRCGSSGFDNFYEMILDYTLPHQEFEEEVARLSQLEMEYGSQTRQVTYDTTSFRYPAYVTLFSKFQDYEYALIDGENCRIICVLCCNRDIKKLPLDKEFLPLTDELYADAEGWYGYSIYHFQLSDKGALVVPSPKDD